MIALQQAKASQAKERPTRLLQRTRSFASWPLSSRAVRRAMHHREQLIGDRTSVRLMNIGTHALPGRSSASLCAHALLRLGPQALARGIRCVRVGGLTAWELGRFREMLRAVESTAGIGSTRFWEPDSSRRPPGRQVPGECSGRGAGGASGGAPGLDRRPSHPGAAEPPKRQAAA